MDFCILLERTLSTLMEFLCHLKLQITMLALRLQVSIDLRLSGRLSRILQFLGCRL